MSISQRYPMFIDSRPRRLKVRAGQQQQPAQTNIYGLVRRTEPKPTKTKRSEDRVLLFLSFLLSSSQPDGPDQTRTYTKTTKTYKEEEMGNEACSMLYIKKQRE